MNKTKIDWADSSWNPITGCLHGCEYCYARGIAWRFEGVWDGDANHKLSFSRHDTPKEVTGAEFGGYGFKYRVGNDNRGEPKWINAPYPYGFHPTLHRYRLKSGLVRWKKPRTIFVGSMTDLFGKWVPNRWIEEVFTACAATPQHTYLFLTKNPVRYIQLHVAGKLNFGNNFWYGTSFTKPGIPYYFSENYNTFLSIEPLLADVAGKDSFDLTKIRWVIIGAESGNRKGKVIPKREWIENIVGDCKAAGIPVFMKESLRGIMGGDFVQEFPWEVRA
jgi:protein gp37